MRKCCQRGQETAAAVGAQALGHSSPLLVARNNNSRNPGLARAPLLTPPPWVGAHVMHRRHNRHSPLVPSGGYQSLSLPLRPRRSNSGRSLGRKTRSPHNNSNSLNNIWRGRVTVLALRKQRGWALCQVARPHKTQRTQGIPLTGGNRPNPQPPGEGAYGTIPVSLHRRPQPPPESRPPTRGRHLRGPRNNRSPQAVLVPQPRAREGLRWGEEEESGQNEEEEVVVVVGFRRSRGYCLALLHPLEGDTRPQWLPPPRCYTTTPSRALAAGNPSVCTITPSPRWT